VKIWATCLLLLATLPAQASTPLMLLYAAAPSFLGAYVAKDQGIFEKHGLNVTLSAPMSSATMPPALEGGSAQIAGTQTVLVVQAVDSGIDLVVIAGTEPYPAPYSQGMLARPGSGIKSVKDLPGHSVASPGIGATMDILARELMIRAGVDPNSVKQVEVALPQMADALRTGSVDVVVAVDPSYSRCLQVGGQPIASWDSLIPPGTYLSVYAVTRDWAKQHPELVAAFRASMDNADAYIADPKNEDAVRASFTRWTHLPAAVVAATKLPHKLTVTVTPASLAFWADVAKDQKLTQNPVNPASLIAP
jgi:NitT/TauT family transport system substrate-binding protein